MTVKVLSLEPHESDRNSYETLILVFLSGIFLSLCGLSSFLFASFLFQSLYLRLCELKFHRYRLKKTENCCRSCLYTLLIPKVNGEWFLFSICVFV